MYCVCVCVCVCVCHCPLQPAFVQYSQSHVRMSVPLFIICFHFSMLITQFHIVHTYTKQVINTTPIVINTNNETHSAAGIID